MKKIVMRISELPIKEIHEIKPLWELLNKTHNDNSNYWKSHFANQTFEKRFAKLTNYADTLILTARVDNEIIGYSFSTVKNGVGELDSIFVKEQYRKTGVGKRLVVQTLNWFKDNQIKEIVVEVAEGNESAFSFYEKLGFRKNMTKLKMV